VARTALVTGGYGFLGRHVARQLARDNWRVIGLGHGSWARDEWKIWGIAEWHSADIVTETLMTYAGEPDVIVHCAGSGSVGFSMTHPYQDFQRTVATTLAILEYARLYAPQACIAYPSSAGVYGAVHKLPIVETDSLVPESPYGVHKRMAEELFACYSTHFGIRAAVVRLFSIYGAGLRKQLLWDASRKIVARENGFFGTGDEIRDWLHVEDAAGLLIAAIDHASAECPIVNGGSGLGVTVRDMLMELFACFGNTELPVFSGTSRGGDPAGYIADISLAQEWGWRPKVGRQEGVREYAEWFKDSSL
jgi:UDP-glucose 4-epimerase